MKKICIAAALMLALGPIFSASAAAATVASTLNVGVTVTALCSVWTTGIDFGTWEGPFGPLVPETEGVVMISCSEGLPYNITLDAGLNPAGVDRRMTNGTHFLSYVLYQENSWSGNLWGDSDFDNTYTYGSSFAGTGTGMASGITVVGHLNQTETDFSTGNYTDVVQVTVHY